MGKGRKEKKRSYKKAVVEFNNNHSRQMPAKAKRSKKQGIALPKNPRDMVPGDEFECGSNLKFTGAVLRTIRYVCFDCGRRFDTFELKIKHMGSRHSYPDNTQICRACFSLNDSPHNHTHKIPLLENLRNSGNDESESGSEDTTDVEVVESEISDD